MKMLTVIQIKTIEYQFTVTGTAPEIKETDSNIQVLARKWQQPWSKCKMGQPLCGEQFDSFSQKVKHGVIMLLQFPLLDIPSEIKRHTSTKILSMNVTASSFIIAKKVKKVKYPSCCLDNKMFASIQ